MPRPSRYSPDNLPRPRSWRDEAACAEVDTAVFFPVSTPGSPSELEAEYAKTFCALCPVQSHCLRHALTHREDYGVWGGLDEHERAALLRRARRAAEQARREEKERAGATA
jgi:WhiB family redox-sensing transcriptional regulator